MVLFEAILFSWGIKGRSLTFSTSFPFSLVFLRSLSPEEKAYLEDQKRCWTDFGWPGRDSCLGCGACLLACFSSWCLAYTVSSTPVCAVIESFSLSLLGTLLPNMLGRLPSMDSGAARRRHRVLSVPGSPPARRVAPKTKREGCWIRVKGRSRVS